MKSASRLALIVTAVVALLWVSGQALQAGIGGPYTSGVAVQNLGTVTATVALQFYAQDGTVSGTTNDTIGPSANKTYFPLTAVSAGFNGSLVVSSDQLVAATANVIFPDGSGTTAYNSMSQGATTVNLPLMMRGNVGYLDTWFNVQNTGSSGATVNVTYTGGCTDSKSVPAFAAATFDQSATSCLSDGYVGAATVTSTQQIVATVFEIERVTGPLPKQLLSYNGFTSANTTLIMPIVSSNYYNSGTGITIRNSGGSNTDVSLTYTPSSGLPGHSCVETKTILAGQIANFGWPQLPAACGQTGIPGVSDPVRGGFVGAAQVTTNTASMPLVGIVNLVNRVNAGADAYNAINPANATSKVSMPLIMDRNYGFFTGINIANVGTQSTNIACTFRNTGYNVPSTPVAPGAALTAVQLNQIASGYVGSGTCTATGGDAKIAGIVTQLLLTAPAANDGLSDYAAFNY